MFNLNYDAVYTCLFLYPSAPLWLPLRVIVRALVTWLCLVAGLAGNEV